MKKCPYCAEEIQGEALKCKHCGEFLNKNTGEKWYFKPGSIILLFLCAGPLVLPLVWIHPRLSKTQKILITGIALIITYYLMILMEHSMKSIMAYYNQLNSVLQTPSG